MRMKFRYLCDNHIHTDCSRDGADPAMMMCESAARLGFYAVTITDHCECNAYYSERYDRSIRQSYFEARKASAAFNGRLGVLSGVEIGQPLQGETAAADILDACEFDFVLASVHNVKGEKDFFDLDYGTADIEGLLERYFDELSETIEWGRFDSLAHLTYPWRYLSERSVSFDAARWDGRIDSILKQLIAKGRALELNTSGFRQKLGVSLPDLPVVRRYREYGGKLITIGSDAHRWADVGAGIEQGLELLRQAGFHHYTVYLKHRPKFLPIG